MRVNWEVVKPSLWTGVGGVVVLLSYGFGFMSRAGCGPHGDRVGPASSGSSPPCFSTQACCKA
jgi:hypothetical protein